MAVKKFLYMKKFRKRVKTRRFGLSSQGSSSQERRLEQDETQDYTTEEKK